MSKKAAGKPRTIVLKFNDYKTRETILKNKKCLKGTNVFVRENFSQKVFAKRKELLPKIHEEWKKGNIAFLRFDKLVVYPGRIGRESSTTISPHFFSPAGKGRGSAWQGSPGNFSDS